MKLKELRLKEHKTQKEMAKILNISLTGYNSYEIGRTEPTQEMLVKIADYFHTTTDNLLEHTVPYLLDKSTLTPQQREIIEIVQKMDIEQCRYTLAYIEGFKKAIEERNENFNLPKINNKEFKEMNKEQQIAFYKEQLQDYYGCPVYGKATNEKICKKCGYKENCSDLEEIILNYLEATRERHNEYLTQDKIKCDNCNSKDIARTPGGFLCAECGNYIQFEESDYKEILKENYIPQDNSLIKQITNETVNDIINKQTKQNKGSNLIKTTNQKFNRGEIKKEDK